MVCRCPTADSDLLCDGENKNNTSLTHMHARLSMIYANEHAYNKTPKKLICEWSEGAVAQ
jgi:hypothetical protein